MNPRLIAELIRLRYKLIWAKTRSRNGRIALFITGYLLLSLLLMLLAAGGLGAGIVAIKSGKAEFVSQAVLAGLYVQVTLAAVILGFGINTAFSDAELRRYPLSARDRLLARNFIGLMDPFWLLILALEAGFVASLYALGGFSFLGGLFTIVILFVSNYLLARLVGLLIDRLVSRKSGSALLLVFVMSLALLPALARPFVMAHRDSMSKAVSALRYTPPFAAAAALTHSGAQAWPGLGLVLLSILVLGAAVVSLERRPPPSPSAEKSGVLSWRSPLDRAAAIFGPHNAPLVAFWLRFYARNNRFRALYALSVPLIGFLAYNLGFSSARRPGGAEADPAAAYFVATLGAIAAVSFIGTSRIAVNQFGYLGGAFRRFFLFPTDPAACLRAGSYACMLAGGIMIPVALIAWAILGPRNFGIPGLVMLAGSAITGLFLFHGVGLWATLYGARRGNYSTSLGNDSSLTGNIVAIGAIVGSLALPQVLSRAWPPAVSVQNWWGVLPVALVAVVFYFVSLRAASSLLASRREALMAILEGRES